MNEFFFNEKQNRWYFTFVFIFFCALGLERMCIINGSSVDNVQVQGTKIIVGTNGTTQFTIYQNAVSFLTNVSATSPDSPTPAMILPVPCSAKEMILVPTELNDDETFVKRGISACEIPFVEYVTAIPYTVGNETRGVVNLEVKKCGNYQYSIAQGVDELAKMDPKVFLANPEVLGALAKYYAKREFCFLILRLIPGAVYKPILYLAPLPKNQKLFIPTLHIHPNGKDSFLHEVEDHWDHTIYSLNATITPLPNNNQQQLDSRNAEKKILFFLSIWLSLFPGFEKLCLSNLHRWMLKGSAVNQDMEAVLLAPSSDAPTKT